MKEEPIYITGHQHPDTDSIVSAIALAFFKRAQGEKAVPCRLGSLNHETKWLLNRFHFEEPMLLKDARKTIEEIDIDAPAYVTPEMSILDVTRSMEFNNRSSMAVVDENKQLIGIISKSDLANLGLGDTAAEIELLRQTDVFHLAEVIDGNVIYEAENGHINGKVSIITLAASKTANYDIRDRIVIVGDDPGSQLDLIEKGAGILIVVWCRRISQKVIDAAEKHNCSIIQSGHGSMNTTRYLFLAPPVKLVMNQNPLTFYCDELVEEAGRKMMKTRYRSYPVTDHAGHLKGYIARYHLLNYHNKKIILVDHNEFAQSVKAVEKAQILQVIDHHRINDFATSQPVSFRNEIVGSTATIITTMYRENQIPMTREMAGLLLGAVLSDTLMLQSPTTTPKDHTVANILAAIANVDIEAFGHEMFSANAHTPNESVHDMLMEDIKYFELNGIQTMISQVIITKVEQIRERSDEIQAELDHIAQEKNLDLVVAAFSSVLDYGSIFYAAGEYKDKCTDAFPDTDGPHTLQKNILSRKLQIVPKLNEVLNG